MSRVWMPLYWGDYLRDTRDLTTLQHGAYLLLIAHYWQHTGLPAEESRLAAIAGLPLATWRRISPAIAAKFSDGWRHKRIDAEIVRCERAMHQRRVAGQKGGERSAVTRAIALGAAIKAAQRRAPALAAAAAAAAAAASGMASGMAGGMASAQPPGAIHNQSQNLSVSSSESAAARESSTTSPQPVPHKRPHELTRAEFDAMLARRRGGGSGETPGGTS
jgi:uncharacterized protein YdaU (DUF1376 family)